MAAAPEKERAQTLVRAEFERIAALVAIYDAATTPEAQDEICRKIVGDTPQIAVRSNWHRPGDEDHVSEYRILLSGAAPTIQIIGDIEAGEPYTARLGYQDWYTRWDEFALSEEEEAVLLTYARCYDFIK